MVRDRDNKTAQKQMCVKVSEICAENVLKMGKVSKHTFLTVMGFQKEKEYQRLQDGYEQSLFTLYNNLMIFFHLLPSSPHLTFCTYGHLSVGNDPQVVCHLEFGTVKLFRPIHSWILAHIFTYPLIHLFPLRIHDILYSA